MLWEWLTAISTGRSLDNGVLPALQKPPFDPQQQQQQQQTLPGAAAVGAGQHAEKEYCLRMAFKLTPKYSSKLQVSTLETAANNRFFTACNMPCVAHASVPPSFGSITWLSGLGAHMHGQLWLKQT